MAETEFSRLVADVREQLLYLQELGVTELDVEMPEFAALAATPAAKACRGEKSFRSRLR